MNEAQARDEAEKRFLHYDVNVFTDGKRCRISLIPLAREGGHTFSATDESLSAEGATFEEVFEKLNPP